jgi:predicted membrane-bound mannosyltransferase
LLRNRLGNLGALMTTLVLAASPLLINVSRTAGGDSIAVLAVTLTLVAALRLRQSGEQRWEIVLGCALGLGFTSAPLFFSGLVTLALAWYLALHSRPDDRNAVWQIAPQQSTRAMWQTVGLAAAIVFVLLSTFFLLHPQGLGAAARLPAIWLSQFGLPTSTPDTSSAVTAPLLALGRYEPLMLLSLPGIVAALWSLGQKEQPGLFFIAWLAALVTLWLLQPGVLNNSMLVILPVALIIGLSTAALYGRSPATSRVAWGVAAGLVLLGMLILVSLARFTRLAASNPVDSPQLWLVILGVLAAATLMFAAATWDGTAALQGLWAGAAGLLLFFQWGTGWHLNQLAANDPRERWVMVGTHNEVRLLAESLTEISQQAVGSSHDLAVFSVVDSPVLGWYLRDFSRFQSGAAVPLQADSDVVISPPDTELALDNDYVGTDFHLLRQKPAVVIPNSQSRLLDVLNGWLFHESRAPVDEMQVILWIRSDLLEP